jgi:hypothetical protein
VKSPLVRPLAAGLAVGSVMLAVSAALHPVLPLTGPEDLRLIHATRYWHPIHLGLLYGTGLIIVGIWSRWLAADPTERSGLAIGFMALALGQALNGMNIAYMLGAGSLLGGLNDVAPDVARLYDATHAFAVMTGRLGGFLVALAAGLIAYTTARTSGEPRALVGLAWFACVAGIGGNFLAPPGHPFMLASIGIMAVWQTVTAVRLLRQA